MQFLRTAKNFLRIDGESVRSPDIRSVGQYVRPENDARRTILFRIWDSWLMIVRRKQRPALRWAARPATCGMAQMATSKSWISRKLASAHLAEAERRISEQRAFIKHTVEHGHSARQAERALERMVASQSLMRTHFDELLAPAGQQRATQRRSV
jgi:hypothetical protein